MNPKQQLLENLRRTEETMSSEWGAFTLFGLFGRDDGSDRWDLVASAPWLTSSRASIQQIVEGLQRHLTYDEWLEFKLIVPLRPEEPFVQTVLRMLDPVEHGLRQVSLPFMTDFLVNRAVIITARPSPVPQGQTREAVLAS